MVKRILLLLVIGVVLGWNVLIYFIDDDLANTVSDNRVYENCAKIWSARGFYETKDKENSITAFNSAFALGGKGAEVDFFYDIATDRFIVSHGSPKKSATGELVYEQKEGRTLTLDYLFSQVSPEQYFWLDYKNLDRIGDLATESAIKRLDWLNRRHDLSERVYIEGSNPYYLSSYTQAGFKTILGIHPLPEQNWLANLSVNVYKVAYYFSDITVLAMPYGALDNPKYSEQAAKSLSSIPMFLFHVPIDMTLFASLLKNDNVRVFLAGRDMSVNYFDMTACEG